jgi:hypothetical protein
MVNTANDNTSSLSLALDARKAVKALISYRRDGVRDECLRQVIADAVASLNALNTGVALFANLSHSSSYESYEQIRTVQEVQTALSDNRLVQKLQVLLDVPQPEGLQESLDLAIHFFTAIENRALQKYNQAFGMGV